MGNFCSTEQIDCDNDSSNGQRKVQTSIEPPTEIAGNNLDDPKGDMTTLGLRTNSYSHALSEQNEHINNFT
eukprot:m.1640316 g.1640316  ORF g.1640316 m.1640316 type:complete len:71 (-) comp41191_c0_seq1:394-606(-)